MAPLLEATVVGLLGVGMLGVGGVRSLRGTRGPTATGLLVVGLVCLSVATTGAVESGVSGFPSLSAILVTAALVGFLGLCVGSLRDDPRLATAGYCLGCAGFAAPAAFVGRDARTIVVAVAVTLLFAGLYGALAERTPARTVTVGSGR